jgi:hypothetical protein
VKKYFFLKPRLLWLRINIYLIFSVIDFWFRKGFSSGYCGASGGSGGLTQRAGEDGEGQAGGGGQARPQGHSKTRPGTIGTLINVVGPNHTATKTPWELRGLSPNFHVHASGERFFIFPGSVHIFSCSRIGR